MEYLTIVNRTSKNLEGVWDGKHYVLTPGKHQFPAIQAQKFREQNPIMGSENPYTLERKYLIGIVEEGDDLSPIEQTDAVELTNRSLLNVPVMIVPANGLPLAGERKSTIGQVNGPVATSFVTP